VMRLDSALPMAALSSRPGGRITRRSKVTYRRSVPWNERSASAANDLANAADSLHKYTIPHRRQKSPEKSGEDQAYSGVLAC
jgi:hypothetical protein